MGKWLLPLGGDLFTYAGVFAGKAIAASHVSPVPREPVGNCPSVSPSLSSCPFLARQLTLAIPIIAALLFFFVMSCLLQTSFTDPGILPRATVCEAAALEKQIGEARLQWKLCPQVHGPRWERRPGFLSPHRAGNGGQ